MEDRIAKFVAALRASGVRVSVAESQDAWQAIKTLGVKDRDVFRISLRATLVKDAQSIPTFEELFPQYFGNLAPPLLDPQADLSPEQQQMLQDLINQLVQDLKRLVEWLLNGTPPTREELEDLAAQSGLDQPGQFSPYSARSAARRMKQLLGWDQLQELLNQLWKLLAEHGMDPDTLKQLRQQVAENQQGLEQQLDDFAGEKVRDHMVEEAQRRRSDRDLMNRSFDALTLDEMNTLREQVRRLAARLRSRAALRQKRGKQGKLDPKATIRSSLRYQGVPFELRYRHRRLKPKVVAILDVSTSMRPVAEFFLRLLYELQDQIQKTRSFAFIDHLEDVTPDLLGVQIDEAIYIVLTKLPPGHYNTDLGYSLQQFEMDFMDAVDRRTTVIVLGDGRNNYNDPGVDVFERIGQRSRRLIWMNPEHPTQWGTTDSDMLHYAPLCSDVFQVRNLAQLIDAIDHILV
jgi:uncharacterized protein with von Willebrand factor type A (vWA) domain